jgi:hypothetical protein
MRLTLHLWLRVHTDAFLAEFCAFTCGCLQSLKSVEEVEFSWNLDCFNYLTDAWLVFGTSAIILLFCLSYFYY